jgi:hypothetical protein
MKEVLEVLGIFALSAVKFGIAGVPAAVFAKFSFFKTMVVTVSGGLVGTLFFTYLSDWVLDGIERIRLKFRKGKPAPKKKLFTRSNRMLVKVKAKFGLIGLAVITPLILSIPLGAFLAVRYYHNKQKIILFMSVSIFCWALLLYFFYNFFYSKFVNHFS